MGAGPRRAPLPLTRPRAPSPSPPLPRRYTPLLAVLAALQAEGFLRFSSHESKAPAYTLIYSNVVGEAAHSVPRPRRATEGVNSFTLQFVRRLIIDHGVPLRALLDAT